MLPFVLREAAVFDGYVQEPIKRREAGYSYEFLLCFGVAATSSGCIGDAWETKSLHVFFFILLGTADFKRYIQKAIEWVVILKSNRFSWY